MFRLAENKVPCNRYERSSLQAIRRKAREKQGVKRALDPF
jgi:hypothetical protein